MSVLYLSISILDSGMESTTSAPTMRVNVDILDDSGYIQLYIPFISNTCVNQRIPVALIPVGIQE